MTFVIISYLFSQCLDMTESLTRSRTTEGEWSSGDGGIAYLQSRKDLLPRESI